MAAKKTPRKKRPAPKRVKKAPPKPARKKTTPKKIAPKKKTKTKTKGLVIDGRKKGKGSGSGNPDVPEFIANQWKPGQSGNPSGRPKGSISMTATLRQMLLKKCPDEWKAGLDLPKDATVKDGIMAAATKAAAKGDHKFFATIFDRIDGKVPDIVHSTTRELDNLSEDELAAIIKNGHGEDGEGEALAPGAGEGDGVEDGDPS